MSATTTTPEPVMNEWLINDEIADVSPDTPAEQAPWRILIVDDDVDVHVVTKFSLRNATFKGRQLSFLHAYSGKEGYNILRDTPDVALVLLDVVMETEYAGLVLARQIRGELNNHLVRIVLRTGQCGQAMEQSVIVDYDVNDYRTKSDLTTQKLFTTVISSLRSYDSMLAAERHHEALKLAQGKIRGLETALDQHTMVAITDRSGKIIYANDKFCAKFQYTREELLDRDQRIVNPADQSPEFLQEIWSSISTGAIWHGQLSERARDGSLHSFDTSIVPFLNAAGEPYQYLSIRSEITGSQDAPAG